MRIWYRGTDAVSGNEQTIPLPRKTKDAGELCYGWLARSLRMPGISRRRHRFSTDGRHRTDPLRLLSNEGDDRILKVKIVFPLERLFAAQRDTLQFLRQPSVRPWL
jgi:hypothetical protein